MSHSSASHFARVLERGEFVRPPLLIPHLSQLNSSEHRLMLKHPDSPMRALYFSKCTPTEADRIFGVSDSSFSVIQAALQPQHAFIFSEPASLTLRVFDAFWQHMPTTKFSAHVPPIKVFEQSSALLKHLVFLNQTTRLVSRPTMANIYHFWSNHSKTLSPLHSNATIYLVSAFRHLDFSPSASESDEWLSSPGLQSMFKKSWDNQRNQEERDLLTHEHPVHGRSRHAL
jgi:hypothetical protein